VSLVLLILPGDDTFVAADDGVHTFMVTFKSGGTQTLTATDTHTGPRWTRKSLQLAHRRRILGP
jgi:hypothetical protein